MMFSYSGGKPAEHIILEGSVSFGLLRSIFYLLCFLAVLVFCLLCSKLCPQLLQLCHSLQLYKILLFLLTIDQHSQALDFNFYLLLSQNAFLLFLTYCAQYYAHEKTCALFCTKWWLDCYLTKDFKLKDCFKIFPIMLALCLILAETYYAGIIGLGLQRPV